MEGGKLMATHSQMSDGGVLEFSGANNPNWTSNLSLSYSGGQLKIVSADGTALSTDNPGWVTFQSKNNPGQLVTVEYTADTYLIDDDTATTSDIVGTNFGTTTGVAWGNELPFGLYAVYNETTGAKSFAISRDWMRNKTPSSSTLLGYHGNAPSSNDEQNWFFMQSTSPNTDFASEQSAQLIGFVYGVKSASDDWTFSAPDHEETGIGRFPWGRKFTMPTGQNGASTNKYGNNSGGTFPEFTNNANAYWLHPTGDVSMVWTLDSVSVAGVGAPTLLIYLPYTNRAQTSEEYQSSARLRWSSGSTIRHAGIRLAPDGVNSIRFGFRRFDNDAAPTQADFSAGSGLIATHFKYKAFNRG